MAFGAHYWASVGPSGPGPSGRVVRYSGLGYRTVGLSSRRTRAYRYAHVVGIPLYPPPPRSPELSTTWMKFLSHFRSQSGFRIDGSWIRKFLLSIYSLSITEQCYNAGTTHLSVPYIFKHTYGKLNVLSLHDSWSTKNKSRFWDFAQNQQICENSKLFFMFKN